MSSRPLSVMLFAFRKVSRHVNLLSRVSGSSGAPIVFYTQCGLAVELFLAACSGAGTYKA